MSQVPGFLENNGWNVPGKRAMRRVATLSVEARRLVEEEPRILRQSRERIAQRAQRVVVAFAVEHHRGGGLAPVARKGAA
jgi:hypothetical protein